MSLPHAKTNQLRYVFLADLAWFGIGYLSAWRTIDKSEGEAEQVYNRLSGLANRQEISEANIYQVWHEQLENGEITLKQLRKQLPTGHGSSSIDTLSDAMADRVVNMQFYQRIKAAREYGNLRIVVVPDGVTDELCYEFRSVKNHGTGKRQLKVVRDIAHMDAYLLGRPNILAHVHVRSDDKHHYISEPLNREVAENLLDYVGRPDVWMANWEAKRK